MNRVLPGTNPYDWLRSIGLIVSYQLMQAGADVVALVEAAPKIGYGVHASKIAGQAYRFIQNMQLSKRGTNV